MTRFTRPAIAARACAALLAALAAPTAHAALDPVEFTFSGRTHTLQGFPAFPFELSVLGQTLEFRVLVNYDQPDQDPSHNRTITTLGPSSIRNVSNDVGVTAAGGIFDVKNDFQDTPGGALFDDAIQMTIFPRQDLTAQIFILSTGFNMPSPYLTTADLPREISLAGVDGADMVISGNFFTIAARIDTVTARVVPAPAPAPLLGLALLAATRRTGNRSANASRQ